MKRDDSAGQPSLWTPDELQPTVAEAAVLHFAQQYRDGCSEHSGARAAPRWMDECGFACLMICAEHSGELSHNAALSLANSRIAAAERGDIEWLDALPWDLALEVLGTKTNDPMRGVESLMSNLTHYDSGIRLYIFQLAWFVRAHLPVEDAARRLLRNAADTLSYWWDSFGLCSYLFGSEDEFWAFADSYQPDSMFLEQYHDRVRLVRDYGLGMCRYTLCRVESEIRRKICDFALGSRCIGHGI